MTKVLVTEQYLADIANSIRDKLGTSDKLYPSDMSSAINQITVGGSESGAWGSLEINSNGTYDVSSYAEVMVDIESPKVFLVNTVWPIKIFPNGTYQQTLQSGGHALTYTSIGVEDENTAVYIVGSPFASIKVVDFPGTITGLFSGQFDGTAIDKTKETFITFTGIELADTITTTVSITEETARIEVDSTIEPNASSGLIISNLVIEDYYNENYANISFNVDATLSADFTFYIVNNNNGMGYTITLPANADSYSEKVTYRDIYRCPFIDESAGNSIGFYVGA